MSVRVGTRIGPLSVSVPLRSRTADAAAGDAVLGLLALLGFALLASVTGFGLLFLLTFLLWRILTYPLVACGRWRRRVSLARGVSASAFAGVRLLLATVVLALAAGVLLLLCAVAVFLWGMGWFGLLVLFVAICAGTAAAAK